MFYRGEILDIYTCYLDCSRSCPFVLLSYVLYISAFRFVRTKIHSFSETSTQVFGLTPNLNFVIVIIRRYHNLN